MRQKAKLESKDNVVSSVQKEIDYNEKVGISMTRLPRKQHRPWRNKVRKKAAKEAKRKLEGRNGNKHAIPSSDALIMKKKRKSRIRKTNYPSSPNENDAMSRQEMNVVRKLWNYFRKDPQAFELYHKGYQKQAKKWPYNPVRIIIQWIRSLKHDGLVIADLGCGNATIADALSHIATVHSFDLIAANDRVTACDMSM
uniref:Ribosomal RNA-processing protein 8 n=1 Tax=Loa loa TaxID=7209 RepID=A0A1I7VHF1_LOALO